MSEEEFQAKQNERASRALSILGYLVVACEFPRTIGETLTQVSQPDGSYPVQQAFKVIGLTTVDEFEHQGRIGGWKKNYRLSKALRKRYRHFYRVVTD